MDRPASSQRSASPGRTLVLVCFVTALVFQATQFALAQTVAAADALTHDGQRLVDELTKISSPQDNGDFQTILTISELFGRRQDAKEYIVEQFAKAPVPLLAENVNPGLNLDLLVFKRLAVDRDAFADAVLNRNSTLEVDRLVYLAILCHENDPNGAGQFIKKRVDQKLGNSNVDQQNSLKKNLTESLATMWDRETLRQKIYFQLEGAADIWSLESTQRDDTWKLVLHYVPPPEEDKSRTPTQEYAFLSRLRSFDVASSSTDLQIKQKWRAENEANVNFMLNNLSQPIQDLWTGMRKEQCRSWPLQMPTPKPRVPDDPIVANPPAANPRPAKPSSGFENKEQIRTKFPNHLAVFVDINGSPGSYDCQIWCTDLWRIKSRRDYLMSGRGTGSSQADALRSAIGPGIKYPDLSDARREGQDASDEARKYWIVIAPASGDTTILSNLLDTIPKNVRNDVTLKVGFIPSSAQLNRRWSGLDNYWSLLDKGNWISQDDFMISGRSMKTRDIGNGVILVSN